MWLAELLMGAAVGIAPVPAHYFTRLAAEAAAGDVPTSTIVAGGLALASAALAAWLGSRGTLRTAEVQREQNFDKRIDSRNEYLERRNAELETKVEEITADRNKYREMYVQLRIDVRARGLDPDNLTEGDAG
ncbi:hypothetical protein AB0F93_00015 [Micromonospora tulbaghiae]|uniref:hypothetical protein n=1 Tax=Micromonospora tulbaghiae TaxID=479978 RepID=UPI0033190DCE